MKRILEHDEAAQAMTHEEERLSRLSFSDRAYKGTYVLPKLRPPVDVASPPRRAPMPAMIEAIHHVTVWHQVMDDVHVAAAVLPEAVDDGENRPRRLSVRPP